MFDIVVFGIYFWPKVSSRFFVKRILGVMYSTSVYPILLLSRTDDGKYGYGILCHSVSLHYSVGAVSYVIIYHSKLHGRN